LGFGPHRPYVMLSPNARYFIFEMREVTVTVTLKLHEA
jgi:hypothetical protein